MVNTLVCGFDQIDTNLCIEALEDNNILNITSWIVTDKEFKYNPKQIWWNDLIYNKNYNVIKLTQREIKYIYDNMYVYEQHVVRESNFELDSIQEVRNFIFKCAYYLKDLVINKQIKQILFSDIPHGAYNYLFYSLAKLWGIRTVIVVSSFWIGKSYIIENIEDFGKFTVDGNEFVHIEQKYEKNLPYMNFKTKKEQYLERLASINNVYNLIESRKKQFFKNKNKYKDSLDYIYAHVGRYVFRQKKKRDYRANYQRFIVDSLPNQKFVYFPLHEQPEMTTDSLGGYFYDQLLALEQLSLLIPDDWKVLVKENPIQTPYMRGNRFFERINNLDKVMLVSKEVNTYDLIKNCEFVATITGTAGWEAITGGKPALVFGVAWYRYFPGVTIYNDDTVIEDVVNKCITHEDVEKSLYYLQRHTYPFALTSYEANNIDNFDLCKNISTMYTYMSQYLLENKEYINVQ